MSVSAKIEVVLDTASPEMRFLQENVTPYRIAAEIGPRATRLVQRNFLKRDDNKQGFPSTHFWARAAEATNWQAGLGFVMIGINQIGVRQRLEGGEIKPTGGRKYLTIPAIADAYGKRASEFGNLHFAFAQDPNNPGTVRPALVENSASNVKIGKQKKDGSRSVTHTSSATGLIAVFWLLGSVSQVADPTVLPSDDDFSEAMDQSIDALMRHPTLTN